MGVRGGSAGLIVLVVIGLAAFSSSLFLNLRICFATPESPRQTIPQSIYAADSLNGLSGSQEHYVVVVGVMSALDHFELRQQWRSCIMKQAHAQKAKVVFLLGDKECHNNSKTPFPSLGCRTSDPGAVLTDSALLRRVRAEAAQHKDIVLLDMVDVYRNLARKLKLFYKWASDNVKFDFTMKTDDDSWLNLELLVPALEQEQPRDKLWLGKFKSDLTVARFGKSKEPDYGASKYPTFARGVGNVLSADLAHWIGRNADLLHEYQGEDVSAGIWLSALDVVYKYNIRFHSFSCKNNMFSEPQVPLDKLQLYCNNYAKCRRVCNCTGESPGANWPAAPPARHNIPFEFPEGRN
eukprot:TRINITY_DN8298_c0_g1_i1.p1 TRINITY_DN8298_c0_g1~~TRINITY_DN8298_c0_g1_i1.p1  ORF type:complete len:351 (+),score=89.53 TRINITY_DN8298_c0_g1_i1:94-1146(+)